MPNKSETRKELCYPAIFGDEQYHATITHPDGHKSEGIAFTKEEAEKRAAERAEEYDDDDDD